jgi:hypothetical protein
VNGLVSKALIVQLLQPVDACLQRTVGVAVMLTVILAVKAETGFCVAMRVVLAGRHFADEPLAEGSRTRHSTIIHPWPAPHSGAG